MAQAGYTPILIYASGTATNIPTSGNLISGSSGAELAINYADGKLYYKDGSGNVKLLSIGYGSSSVTPTNGGVQYGTGTALALTAAGSSGQILRSNGAAAPTWADLSTLGVNTISFGTTGLTPNSATAGAVTVAGTLVTANGGTGLGGATPFTANGVLYASSASALTSGSALTFDGTTLSALTSGTSVYFSGGDSSVGRRLQLYATSTTNTGDTQNINALGSTGVLAFALNSSEQMRLTSTGLGIGTSSPGAKLDVQAGATSDAAVIRSTLNTNGAAVAGVALYGGNSSGTSVAYSAIYGNIDSNTVGSHGGGMRFYTATSGSFTEKMRLDSSGNLGIGTSSPTTKLYVTVSAASTACAAFFNTDTANGNGLYVKAGGANSGKYALAVENAAGTSLAYLDSSGNLGLGVTPSAWGSGKAIEVGATGNGIWADSGYTDLMQNVLYSAGAYRYVRTASAARFDIENNTFRFLTAPSGTAGNAITFTQAMTLDASGNLGVGETSPGFRIDIKGTSSSSFLQAQNSTSTHKAIYGVDAGGGVDGAVAGSYSNHAFILRTNNTERARITSGGDLYVGQTTAGLQTARSFSWQGVGDGSFYVSHSTANASGDPYMRFGYDGTQIGSITQNGTTGVLYNITSDYRLKNVIGSVTGSGERIDALEPVDYTWKADGSTARGFLAHKFQEVYPNSVTGSKDEIDTEGNPVYQAMQASSSEVIADLVAEIQSLRQRVALLEGN